jgi:glycosyltransferase involved in cell wall biosynthesis
MAVAEAQAVGVPVVGFDAGGIADALHPKLRRLLVSVGKMEELWKRADLILSERVRIPSAFEMRAWIKENYSSVAIARAQTAVYFPSRSAVDATAWQSQF